VSVEFRATGVNLATSLQARANREASERLSERMAASSASVVLQMAAAVEAILSLLSSLLVVVVTVRAMSSSSSHSVGQSPPSSPRAPVKEIAKEDIGIDFWTEVKEKNFRFVSFFF
jgi:hypothetical protein